MADEYLLEVRSQEMPPAFQRRTIRQLATRIFEELMGRGRNYLAGSLLVYGYWLLGHDPPTGSRQ